MVCSEACEFCMWPHDGIFFFFSSVASLVKKEQEGKTQGPTLLLLFLFLCVLGHIKSSPGSRDL